jgi:hypothetical protein
MVEHSNNTYTIAWCSQIAELPKDSWDHMAQPLESPFFEWDWLHNLEVSHSATANSGWQPCHLTVWRSQEHQSGHEPTRELIAAAPLYLKSHSYGEFVFDQQWAELAYRLGLDYYPKLLGMSPFTPAVGYRFLIAPGEDELEITRLMVAAIDQFCDRNKILGCHLLYVDPNWKPMIDQCGFQTWTHHNSVWVNQGFGNFDDYLQIFNANQRRNIKRERKAMAKAGLRLEAVTGAAAPHNYFNWMHSFYQDHCNKFGWWGSKYLTKAFFEAIEHTSRHRLLFVAAYQEQDERKPVGMSFCVYKSDRLYGRYWGCDREYDCLHFNACYYTPIEWAIANNIQLFDPGAGGRHKKRRGFPALPHYSVHRFYNQRFEQILGSYLQQVNELEQQEMEAINRELPFKVATN